MSFETVFNPGARPVFVDAAGRTVDPGAWVSVDTSDPVVARGLRTGALLRVDTPEDGADDVTPEAADALQATRDSRTASEARAAKKTAGKSKTRNGTTTVTTTDPTTSPTDPDADADGPADPTTNTDPEAS